MRDDQPVRAADPGLVRQHLDHHWPGVRAMTAPGAGPLADVLRPTRTLLLDFDGPVCRLFAGYRAPTIAEKLRLIVAARLDAIPAAMVAAGPVQVLRLSGELHDRDLAQVVADALRDAEVKAAASAGPTPGLHDVLRALHDSGRRVGIVSNNSVEAVREYLRRHELSDAFNQVVARYDGLDPRHLKPDDHLVRLALHGLDISVSTATFLGDSPSDIEAGRATGMSTIGYVNRPAKRQSLIDAGADAIVETMAELAEAIRSTSTPI
jgi:phosphoglycolate phosphatase